MKKIILGFGAATAILSPVMTLVSCGFSSLKKSSEQDIMDKAKKAIISLTGKSSLLNVDAITPSTIIAKATPNILGFTEPIVIGANFKYDATADDALGIVSIKTTIIVGKLTEKVLFKLDGFLATTRLGKMRNIAKQELDTIALPIQNDYLYDSSLFSLINSTKINARNNIDSANNSAMITSAKDKGIVELNKMIANYKVSKSATIVVQGMTSSSFVSLSDSTKLNSAVTKMEVHNKLMKILATSQLSQFQLNTLHEGDIELNSSTKGSLMITIKNHGLDKSFTVLGFKTIVVSIPHINHPSTTPISSGNPKLFTVPNSIQSKVNDFVKVEKTKNQEVRLIEGDKEFVVLPNKLFFNGTKNSATLPHIKINSSKIELKYYIKNGGLSGSLNEVINPETSPMDLSFKDARFIIKASINGRYILSKIYEPIFNKIDAFEKFNDNGLSLKMKKKQDTLSDYVNFISTVLKEGHSYTSLFSKPFSGKIPQLPDNEKPTDFIGVRGSHVFSPFMDGSMASTSFEKDPKLMDEIANQYQSITFAFLNKKIGDLDELAWGGSTPINTGLEKTQELAKQLVNGGSGGATFFMLMNSLRKHRHDFIISMGGQTAPFPWIDIDPIIFARMLVGVAEAFNVQTIDYDIEGGEVDNVRDMESLSIATALAQRVLEKKNKKFKVNLTLPSEWNGLAHGGISTLNQFLLAGVKVNIMDGMAMMMNGKETGDHHGLPGLFKDVTIDKLVDQLIAAYNNVGYNMSYNEAIKRIGVTFNISSDTWENEKLDDKKVNDLLETYRSKGLGLIGYWSLNNDNDKINGSGSTSYTANAVHDALSKYGNHDKNELQPVNVVGEDDRLLAQIRKHYSKFLGTSNNNNNNNILPLDFVEAIKPHNKFYYKSPVDSLVHIYETNWYASKNERPGKGQDNEFLDLGLFNPSASSKTMVDMKNSFNVLDGVSFFSEYKHPSIQNAINLLTQSTGKIILAYQKARKYPGGSIVYKDGSYYQALYYVDNKYVESNVPGVDPGANYRNPWVRL